MSITQSHQLMKMSTYSMEAVLSTTALPPPDTRRKGQLRSKSGMKLEVHNLWAMGQLVDAWLCNRQRERHAIAFMGGIYITWFL